MFGSFIAILMLPAPVRATCFDFSKRVSQPLAAPAQLRAAQGDMNAASGALGDGRVWASAQGSVQHSTEELLQDLITHRATRAGAAKEMTLKRLEDAKNDLLQTAAFTVRPFPLVTVKWLEHWSYNVLKGSFKDPDMLVVAYEKTEGTSHIEHLCGNLTLQKISPGETRVTLYEEVKATRRSEKDTLGGVTETLRELRDTKVAAGHTREPLTSDETGVRSATTSAAP